MTNELLPLEGIRVFDLSQGVAGPYCTMMLAAQGADVIKVEPFEGDWIRSGRNQYRGHSSASITVNMGKRSIALDLKDPQALEAAKKIAAGCDIILESFRPGVVSKLGLDYETLAKDRPELIYASISGYGQTGPLAQRGVVDQIMQACSGWMVLNAGVDGVPHRTRNVVLADQITGLYSSQALCAALIRQFRHGRGTRLDISLMGAMAAFLSSRITAHVMSGGEPGSMYFTAPTGEYSTSDGILTLAARNPSEFEKFCCAADRADLLDDPRFSTPAARAQYVKELDVEVTRALSTRSASEWETLLNSKGVMASVVRTVGDFIETEQMLAQGFLQTLDLEGIGDCPVVQLPGAPAWSSRTASPCVPVVGQHGVEILCEAGYSDLAIDGLLAQGCLRVPKLDADSRRKRKELIHGH